MSSLHEKGNHYAKGYETGIRYNKQRRLLPSFLQFSGSVTFWYVLVQIRELTDPDPALLVSELQDTKKFSPFFA
jgi:hypothetical protein